MKWFPAFLAAAFLAASPAGAEVKVTPVARLNVLGGQYFSANQNTGFGGNVDLALIPVINFSEDSALLPIYTGNFINTQSVQDYQGGATRINREMNHSISLRYLQTLPGGWTLKPRAGFAKEWVEETIDESLSDGLFNNNKVFGGLSADKKLGSWTMSWGYEFAAQRYINYNSLASDPRFSEAGITKTIGTDVLDHNTHSLFTAAEWGLSEPWQLKGDASYARQKFLDQRIIQQNGEYTEALRLDEIFDVGVGGVYRVSDRMVLGLRGAATRYNSDQNAYDSNRTFFTPDYYDYVEGRVTPSMGLGIGKAPIRFDAFAEFSWRQYNDRYVQNASGDFLNEKMNQFGTTLGFGLAYPVSKQLSLKFQGMLVNTTSNMKYEANYDYNYTASNYFLGLGWEY